MLTANPKLRQRRQPATVHRRRGTGDQPRPRQADSADDDRRDRDGAHDRPAHGTEGLRLPGRRRSAPSCQPPTSPTSATRYPLPQDCAVNASENNLTLCSSPEYLEALRDVGVDIVGLTGNHLNDFGKDESLWSVQFYKDQEHSDLRRRGESGGIAQAAGGATQRQPAGLSGRQFIRPGHRLG